MNLEGLAVTALTEMKAMISGLVFLHLILEVSTLKRKKLREDILIYLWKYT